MRTYWIILISTFISTLNVPIWKFKHQIMFLFDHYADHHVGTVVKFQGPSCIIQLFTSVSIHTKLLFLFVILKCAEYQRNHHAKNAYAFASATLLLNY